MFPIRGQYIHLAWASTPFIYLFRQTQSRIAPPPLLLISNSNFFFQLINLQISGNMLQTGSKSIRNDKIKILDSENYEFLAISITLLH